MKYTIAEAAQRSGLTVHTLRFYEKEGLLPFIDRTTGGIHQFKESDLEGLKIINCLKETGMSIKNIREFIKLGVSGDSSVYQRLEILEKHKETVEGQLQAIRNNLKTLDHKIGHYRSELKQTIS